MGRMSASLIAWRPWVDWGRERYVRGEVVEPYDLRHACVEISRTKNRGAIGDCAATRNKLLPATHTEGVLMKSIGLLFVEIG